MTQRSLNNINNILIFVMALVGFIILLSCEQESIDVINTGTIDSVNPIEMRLNQNNT